MEKKSKAIQSKIKIWLPYNENYRKFNFKSRKIKLENIMTN